MNKFLKWVGIATIALVIGACSRIETGEVGLRVQFDKQVNPNELQPGSFNQTLIGDVLHFQVRAVAVHLDNKTPQTVDNSTLKDFDLTLIYEINPAAVSDLWTQQGRSFHAYDKEHNEWFLMYNYMTNITNSASYKAVRKYEAMKVADNRQNIEQNIKQLVMEALKEDHLEGKLIVSQVQVRNVLPADDIVASANAAVRAVNDLKTKQIEVETAKQEAIRIQTLNSNAQAIPYMNAMANMEVAKAVREGRVHTIILPSNFNGFVNVNK
jgi:hypothetical protein